MDQETKEYLDRKLLSLAAKDDVEKLRQETKANFHQLKEENKNQVVEWRQEVKADFEQLRKEGKVDIDPLRKEFIEEFQKLRAETQSLLSQSNKVLTSSLQHGREMEGLREEIKKMESLKEQVKQTENLGAEIRQMAEMIVGLDRKISEKIDGKIIEVLTKLKEMQAPVSEVSNADLENKIKELEAKVKTLEKMILP